MTPQQDEFFSALYEKHFKMVKDYVNATLRNEEKAKDIAQDTFHEAIKHIDTLTAHENPAGWLIQTAKYKLCSEEHTRKRRIWSFISLEQETPEALTAVHEKGYDIVESEDSNPMEIIRRVLTDEEFYLVKRLMFEKTSHLEVAKELGISVWACYKRKTKIRKKLADYFPGYGKKK